jgi:GTPase SAR1 family protein
MFKIAVFGDAGTGETSFIGKLIPNIHERQNLVSLGREVLDYKNCEIWFMTGTAFYGDVFDACSFDADIGIVFYNYRFKKSYRNLLSWAIRFKEVNPNKPVYFIVDKTDLSYRNQRNEILELNEYVDSILHTSVETTGINTIKNIIDRFIEENTPVLSYPIIRDDIYSKL